MLKSSLRQRAEWLRFTLSPQWLSFSCKVSNVKGDMILTLTFTCKCLVYVRFNSSISSYVQTFLSGTQSKFDLKLGVSFQFQMSAQRVSHGIFKKQFNILGNTSLAMERRILITPSTFSNILQEEAGDQHKYRNQGELFLKEPSQHILCKQGSPQVSTGRCVLKLEIPFAPSYNALNDHLFP